MYKQLMSLLLVFVLIFSYPFAAFAQANSQNSDDIEKINKLIENGATQVEATRWLKIEKITKQMETSGQVVEQIDGKVQIIDPPNMRNGISNDDKEYLIEAVKKQLKSKKVTLQEKLSDLKKLEKQNPGRSKYRIDYGDGNWTEFRLTRSRRDLIAQDVTKTCFDNTPVPNEIEYGTAYTFPSDDQYYESMGMTESCYLGSATNILMWTYTVSNSGKHVSVNSATNAVDTSGIIQVSSFAKYINVSDTDYYEQPSLWCEAESQAIYNITGGIGATLTGPLSITVPYGRTWTQYVVFRASLVQEHIYFGYHV